MDSFRTYVGTFLLGPHRCQRVYRAQSRYAVMDLFAAEFPNGQRQSIEVM